MADEIDNEVPATSWAVWAWQAYRDGRLVEKPRALPAVTPAVKVKPLVWTQVASSVYDAPAEGYRIFHHGPDGAVGSCNIHGPDGFFAMRSNLEAAKAAAQADYEARIMSALDVTPAPTLAEAAKVLAEAIDRMPDDEYRVMDLDLAAEGIDSASLEVALRRIAEEKA